MTREQWLRPRWLVWLLVVWTAATVAAPRLSAGAPLPPARGGNAAGDLGRVPAALEHEQVTARLAALGLSDADVRALWQRLAPAERAELAARLDELATGGDPVAAGVAIAIIVAMFVILTLELIGRRVISRPTAPDGVRP
jgi:hypothetical protein